MKNKEFKQIVANLENFDTTELKALRMEINAILADIDTTEGTTIETDHVLNERWKLAESIDAKGMYQKLKYREINKISFYIRPLREHFAPCQACQQRLKEIMSNGTWILGNKSYEPLIELNSTRWEIDDNSWQVLDEHKATKEELERIGIEGYEHIE